MVTATCTIAEWVMLLYLFIQVRDARVLPKTIFLLAIVSDPTVERE